MDRRGAKRVSTSWRAFWRRASFITMVTSFYFASPTTLVTSTSTSTRLRGSLKNVWSITSFEQKRKSSWTKRQPCTEEGWIPSREKRKLPEGKLWSELAKSHECSSTLGIHKFIGTFNINFILSTKMVLFSGKRADFAFTWPINCGIVWHMTR